MTKRSTNAPEPTETIPALAGISLFDKLSELLPDEWQRVEALVDSIIATEACCSLCGTAIAREEVGRHAALCVGAETRAARQYDSLFERLREATAAADIDSELVADLEDAVGDRELEVVVAEHEAISALLERLFVGSNRRRRITPTGDYERSAADRRYGAMLPIIEDALGNEFVRRFDETVGERLAEHMDLAEAVPDQDVEDRLAGVERQAKQIAAKISALVAREGGDQR